MKITPFFIGLSLLCFCSIAQSQTIKLDSLYTVLKTAKEDTNRVNALNLLSHQLYLTGQYDTAMVLTNQAADISTKINYKKGLGTAYFNIGVINYFKSKLPDAIKYDSLAIITDKLANYLPGLADAYNTMGAIFFSGGKYDTALKNYQRAYDYASQCNSKRTMGSASSNMGNVELTLGHYPEALKHYLDARAIDEEIGFKRGLGDVYGNIGLVYYSEGNYDDAVENISKSLKIEKEIGNKISEGNAYHNLGDIFMLQNKHDSSLVNFQKALKLATEIGNKEGMAYAYNNLGAIYCLEKKYDDALTNSLQGLDISRAVGNKYNMANAYINLGSTYTMLKQYDKANKYLDSVAKLSATLNNKEVIRDMYNALNVYDQATGNYKKAFDDYKQFITYRDSLKNEENTKKIVSEQMNFDFQQKESKLKAEQDKQNAVSEEKLKRQKLITWLSAGAFALLLLSSLLLFNRARLKEKNRYQLELNKRQKEQANAVMETQEQERKRIAEDLHDSLGHLLSTIKLNLQASTENQKQSFENSLQLLQQASQEIHNITFNLMPRTLEEEGLVPALREMANRITIAKSTKLDIQFHEVENLTLEKQTQFTIYRIVQEAVNNIIKYAESKEINIQLLKRDDQLVIMIEDDGKGFNIEEVKKGRGLKNMMARSEWLNGKLAIDSGAGRGTTIVVEIPIV